MLNFDFVDWILDKFVHVFLQFFAYHLNFESNSCKLFSSYHVLNQFLEVVSLLNSFLFSKIPTHDAYDEVELWGWVVAGFLNQNKS